MRAVVQRVSRAVVRSEGAETGRIGSGLVVLLGIARGDGEPEARWLAAKLAKLRVFNDADGRMNLPLSGLPSAQCLLVSQFTLHGDARKGNRPSYLAAAPPEQAEPLIVRVVDLLREQGIQVETGVFRTWMEVELVNDGPVTLVLDTADRA